MSEFGKSPRINKRILSRTPKRNSGKGRIFSLDKGRKGRERESFYVYVGKLKKYPNDLPSWQKELHDSLDYMSKAELVLSLGSSYQSTTQIEEELKDF